MDEFGFTTGSAYTGGASSPGMEITIVDTDHPITQGLPETFSVTVDDPETGEPIVGTFGVVTDTSILQAGDVLAVLPTSVDHSAEGAALPDNSPTVIVADAGSSLGNDVRWVFLGYSDVPPNPAVAGVEETRTMAHLTEPAILFLDNIIAWALGEDITSVENWSLW